MEKLTCTGAKQFDLVEYLASLGHYPTKINGHQYLTILHRDAAQPHIHLVANRVSFEGKATSDSNSYKRMANFCRKMEKQFGLKEVLSPRVFQTPEQKQQPRQDVRKEKLRADIKQVLSQVRSYNDFERSMKALGYSMIKARGISFIDNKKVKTKGSDVGFSLATIEKILLGNSKKILIVTPQPQQNDPIKQLDHKGFQEPEYARKEENLIDVLLKHEEEYIAPDPFRKRKKKKNKSMKN